MTNTFASMKKSSKTSITQLNEAASKLTAKPGAREDLRYWQPGVDKVGNGYAVIRFLPASENEDVPFVRLFSHGFKGPAGAWYIENSLTTLGKADPVSELNQKLWNSGIESNKEVVRKQKRQLNYISNIYVVKDPANPENEGKNFLYKYGKKIFDKLNEAMNPQFEDDKAVNPFDLWEGANFKLKIRKVEGYRNYDKSEFETAEVLLADDKELEKVWKSQYSLQAEIAPSKFKTYEELATRLARVLGEAEAPLGGREEPAPVATARAARAAAAPKIPEAASDDGEDDDDSLAFFKKLAEDE
jgi:hypothetical protein